MDHFGNFKVMQRYDKYSIKGLCLYGTVLDFENCYRCYPDIFFYLPEYCNIAIKAKNKELVERFIELMNEEQCLELISSNNCEILFFMAFYCMDSEICMIIYKLGFEALSQFNEVNYQ